MVWSVKIDDRFTFILIHVFFLPLTVERMVQKWAPLVWLAPGEKFFPIEVTHFLRYVTVPTKDGEFQTLPIGPKSEQMFLVTKSNIGKSNKIYFPDQF